MNLVGNLSLDSISTYPRLNLRDGTRLSTIQQDGAPPARYDRVDISLDASSTQPSGSMKDIEVVSFAPPRSIQAELIKAKNAVRQEVFRKMDSMHLSFYEDQKFLDQEMTKWVDNLRQTDPEKFKHYLMITSYRERIEEGRPELASLPKDFTMADYNYYVNGGE